MIIVKSVKQTICGCQCRDAGPEFEFECVKCGAELETGGRTAGIICDCGAEYTKFVTEITLEMIE